MIILDLPQETVQVIEQVAHKNGQSIQDFITISAYEKALQSFATPKDDELPIDFIQKFPKSQLTRSGLEIQKALRDK